MDADMEDITTLDAAALALIDKPVINDSSDCYGYEPGAMLSGDRTLLFPKDGKIRILADCYVLGIEDLAREEHLPCGPCILLVQHVSHRFFAGRFETVAVALKAIDPMKYRSAYETAGSEEVTIF